MECNHEEAIECMHDDCHRCDNKRYVCKCGVILEYHADAYGTEGGDWEEVGHVSNKVRLTNNKRGYDNEILQTQIQRRII